MLNMRTYAVPASLQEAWDIYSSSPSNIILGGCAYLRLGSKRIGTGIDLSGLNMDYIEVHDKYIEIGAMTSLRTLEMSEVLRSYYGDILSDSVKHIVGVSFRNTATIGGSVFGRYGFSDINTALLALGAEVVLYKEGCIAMERFMTEPSHYDILTAVRIPKAKGKHYYEAFRNSMGDYPILTTAVSVSDTGVRIAVGARPMRCVYAAKAMAKLNALLKANHNITKEEIRKIAEIVADELVFGTNMRAKAPYRKHLCKVLVERGLNEVLEWTL